MKSGLMTVSAAVALFSCLVVLVVADTPSNAPPSVNLGKCRILKQESGLCPMVGYLTSVDNVAQAESRIQEYFESLPESADQLQAPCLAAMMEALCLLEFPKCDTLHPTQPMAVPVCPSVRDHVANVCYEPFRAQGTINNNQNNNKDLETMFKHLRTNLFAPVLNHRWASLKTELSEPGCVSLSDQGLVTSPIDNIHIDNDLVQVGTREQNKQQQQEPVVGLGMIRLNEEEEEGAFENMNENNDDMEMVLARNQEHQLKEQEARWRASFVGLPPDIVKSVLDAKDEKKSTKSSSSKKSSKKHHHHHNKRSSKVEDDEQEKVQQFHRRSRSANDQHHHHHYRYENRYDELEQQQEDDGSHLIQKRQDQSLSDQGVLSVNTNSGPSSSSPPQSNILVHETLNHAETSHQSPPLVVVAGGDENQRINAQAPLSVASSSSGVNHDKNENLSAAAAAAQDPFDQQNGGLPHPDGNTVLMAVVPVVLLIGAIAGFTAYRRYTEYRANSRDDDEYDGGILRNSGLGGDGYHPRDIPTRKGSPIHFDRTFLNTIHSPPTGATFLHDRNGSSGSGSGASRNGSPPELLGTMRPPPPVGASTGKKTKFQELSRGYDFGESIRGIRNAFSSNKSSSNSLHGNNSGSTASLPDTTLHYQQQQQQYVFGSGGHQLSPNEPGGLVGLPYGTQSNVWGSGGGNPQQRPRASTAGGSRFPDIKNATITQENAIIWGQYTTNDDEDDLAASAADSSIRNNSSATLGGGNGSQANRKSISTSSLSLLSGAFKKHSYTNQDQGPPSPTDSIGDCLSPESSPPYTQEDIMRRRQLLGTFPFGTGGNSSSSASNKNSNIAAVTTRLGSAHFNTNDYGDDDQEADQNSNTDLLFDARDHYELTEEMDMYLEMEKAVSPLPNMVDYNQSMGSRAITHLTNQGYLAAPLASTSGVEKAIKEEVEEVEEKEFNEKQGYGQQEQETMVLASAAVVDDTKEDILNEKFAIEDDIDEDEQARDENETHVLGNASPDWNEKSATPYIASLAGGAARTTARPSSTGKVLTGVASYGPTLNLFNKSEKPGLIEEEDEGEDDGEGEGEEEEEDAQQQEQEQEQEVLQVEDEDEWEERPMSSSGSTVASFATAPSSMAAIDNGSSASMGGGNGANGAKNKKKNQKAKAKKGAKKGGK